MEKPVYTGPVSPLVKKIVAANHIDLNLVHGTGQDGRITKEDVLNYLETRKSAPSGAVAQTLKQLVLQTRPRWKNRSSLAG